MTKQLANFFRDEPTLYFCICPISRADPNSFFVLMFLFKIIRNIYIINKRVRG
jgi:hypothetical protein